MLICAYVRVTGDYDGYYATGDYDEKPSLRISS